MCARSGFSPPLIVTAFSGHDRVQPIGEFREVGPGAPGEVQRSRREGRVGGPLFLRFGNDTVQRACDEGHGGRLVDVPLDEHLVCGFRGLVRSVGRQQLALQFRWNERTSGCNECDERQERAEADQTGTSEESTGRLRQQFRRLRSLRAFLSDRALGTEARESHLRFCQVLARPGGSTCSRRSGARALPAVPSSGASPGGS